MYLSKLFIPLLKEIPSEAKIKSHQLMLRTGMIKQSSTGIYTTAEELKAYQHFEPDEQ